jgi:hypothetical protein
MEISSASLRDAIDAKYRKGRIDAGARCFEDRQSVVCSVRPKPNQSLLTPKVQHVHDDLICPHFTPENELLRHRAAHAVQFLAAAATAR